MPKKKEDPFQEIENKLKRLKECLETHKTHFSARYKIKSPTKIFTKNVCAKEKNKLYRVKSTQTGSLLQTKTTKVKQTNYTKSKETQRISLSSENEKLLKKLSAKSSTGEFTIQRVKKASLPYNASMKEKKKNNMKQTFDNLSRPKKALSKLSVFNVKKKSETPVEQQKSKPVTNASKKIRETLVKERRKLIEEEKIRKRKIEEQRSKQKEEIIKSKKIKEEAERKKRSQELKTKKIKVAEQKNISVKENKNIESFDRLEKKVFNQDRVNPDAVFKVKKGQNLDLKNCFKNFDINKDGQKLEDTLGWEESTINSSFKN